MSAALQTPDPATAVSIYRVSPRQMRDHVLDCLYAGLMPCVIGSPGIGKSQIMHSIADQLNLELLDERVAGADPTDFKGLPAIENGMAKFMPFEESFPLETTPLPKDKEGWMIFFDEITSGQKAVQAALYKTLLDKKAGNRRFHERVVMTAAGNLSTDRAIVHPVSTALQSRMIWLELELAGHEDEWIEDVALKFGFDSRIIGYLSRYPERLMDFRPDHQDKTFCCPRTWEFMNRLIQGKDVVDAKVALYAGTITSGVAVDFVQFCQVYRNLINIRQVVQDPSGCRIPDDLSEKWATITHLMEKVEDSNLTELATYANRFSLDFKILFFRGLTVRHPELRTHPAYRKALVELSRYLNG